MYEWKCPHCHGKFYSSCSNSDKEIIECCNCKEEMENPYHGDEGRVK